MPATWKAPALFFSLTVLLLALVPILSVLTGASMDFDGAAARATEETGVEMTSNLLVVLRLALAEPTLALLVLGSAIPTLAALIVCFCTRQPSIRTLCSRFRPVGSGVAWKNALPAYGLIFCLVPLCLIAAYVLRACIPGPAVYVQPEGLWGPPLIIALLTAAFLDQGGLLEELGWRGYAQPAMQTYLLNPLNAAILIGVAWGLWHVPRDVVGGVITRLGAVPYVCLYLPSFVMGTVSISIVAAYFMNRTGGSVLPAIMVHGLANDAVGLSGVANLSVALTPYHQFTKNLPFLILCICMVLLSGRRLGKTERPQ